MSFSRIVRNQLSALKRSAFLLNFRDEDIFMVSYPKSGNTWLRMTVGNYMSNNVADFNNLQQLIPDIQMWKGSKYFKEKEGLRIAKTHDPYKSDFKRVIYLARDGRDVAVSQFFHQKKFKRIDPSMTFDRYIKEVFNNRHAMPSSFGQWNTHVTGWLNNAPSSFLLLKYEDMHKDPMTVLGKVIDFYGMEKDTDRMRAAIEKSEFKKMNSLEKQQQDKHDVFKESDKSINFVRKGQIGDYVNHFTPDTLDLFYQVNREGMEKLGYV